jgi:hypothetical protein
MVLPTRTVLRLPAGGRNCYLQQTAMKVRLQPNERFSVVEESKITMAEEMAALE